MSAAETGDVTATSSSAGGYIQRGRYRVRQFAQAIRANLAPLSKAERAEVRGFLPEVAHPLFDAMPSSDQRHGLSVLRALRARGNDHPALLQAALLHDCAKHQGGIRLWHRVAIVLVKAFKPSLLAGWAKSAPPERSSWRYPFWAHANHADMGAALAAEVSCDPMAVRLIRSHQDPPVGIEGDLLAGGLLVALQAADDDS